MRTWSGSRPVVRTLLLALAAGAFAAAGAAADPWKDESGKRLDRLPGGGAFKEEWKPGKYEWQAGNCKYELKQDGGGFKQEYKCGGGAALAAVPLERFLPYGYVDRPDAPVFVLGPEVARAPAGRYCREYQKRVTVGRSTQRAYGTACRQPDGSWELVD